MYIRVAHVLACVVISGLMIGLALSAVRGAHTLRSNILQSWCGHVINTAGKSPDEMRREIAEFRPGSYDENRNANMCKNLLAKW